MSDDARIRRTYRHIHRETWHRGIRADKVADTREHYAVCDGRMWWVTPAACEPTGVALGHPLPDPRLARRLWLTTALARRWLESLGTSPALAHVPPVSYHITVYSRSHFDRGEVFALTPDETLLAERLIADARIGAVVVELNGFLLSRDGRLLVRGYCWNDGVSSLRAVSAELPRDAGPPSALVHVKVGHLLVCPPLPDLRRFLSWLDRCSHHVSGCLTFGDVYTPARRIAL